MIINPTTYTDFCGLQERPMDKRGRKISLILPARHEEKTIGDYFPTFSNLMDLGCIDEVIIADSSDDSRTIDTALEAASDTAPFSDAMWFATKSGEEMPVKAVNVHDERFIGVFNGHPPKEGDAPGKGRAMYLGMAVASGDILLFLDTDFRNIDPRFVYGLAGPFEDPRTVLSKATFELEDTFEGVIADCEKNNTDVGSCDLLLKSVNARTLARPMVKILDSELGLFPEISKFNGPLSGGCGAFKEVWQSLIIPTHYGIEVSYLMQFINKYKNGHYAYDVNMGEVDQESQDTEGRARMAKNIISTVLDHISKKAPLKYHHFAEDPTLFTELYLKQAEGFSVHNTDSQRMQFYASIIREMLAEGTAAIETPILPPLAQNAYFLRNREKLRRRASEATIAKINLVN